MRRLVATTLLAAIAVGCAPGRSPSAELVEDLTACQNERDELRVRATELHTENVRLRQQTETLLDLGGKRLEHLFPLQRIQLGQYTGGFQEDGEPGDDGVKVIVEPIDSDGDIIKAAGEVVVELYDLALPEGRNLLHRCVYPVEEVGDHWYGGAFTNYFGFECRWDSRPPEHDQITARVTFVEYLTGRSFTDQRVVTVKLPQPGTQPMADDQR